VLNHFPQTKINILSKNLAAGAEVLKELFSNSGAMAKTARAKTSAMRGDAAHRAREQTRNGQRQSKE
jgi:hypothetical protein